MDKSFQKKQQKFYCKICDYGCSKKSLYTKHLLTAKHKNGIFSKNNGIKKFPAVFSCKYCNKNYKHKSGQYRHQKICKFNPSQLVQISHKLAMHKNFQHICECGKIYKHASSLSKHKKTCIYLHSLVEEDDISEEFVPSNTVEKLLKNILDENKELKEQMKSLKVGNTYNMTNNNQKLSINVFLNEKCKNAISLKDFVDNIKLSMEDLEFTNSHGFVEGVSNIFLKNLSDMDVTERPIHCSDQKRLQFYVKNEDKWEKDNQHSEIDKSIQDISNKQIIKVMEWTKANPGYEDNPAKMEEYFQLVGKTMGVDCEKNLRKIKKIISENVKIDDKN